MSKGFRWDLSITVLVRTTIWVAFASSMFTITVARLVVSFYNVNTARVAFVTKVPSPLIAVWIIGATDVKLQSPLMRICTSVSFSAMSVTVCLNLSIT